MTDSPSAAAGIEVVVNIPGHAVVVMSSLVLCGSSVAGHSHSFKVVDSSLQSHGGDDVSSVIVCVVGCVFSDIVDTMKFEVKFDG